MTDFEIQDDVLIKYHGKESSICIPKCVTKIKQFAFANRKDLIHVTIPDTVTFIGNEAFSGCVNLQSVDIPESVTSIQSSAFADCDHLTNIQIPEHLQRNRIGSQLFSPRAPLEHYSGDFIIINHMLIQYRGNHKTVSVPEGVTYIHAFAFENACEMEHLILPESVETVSRNAIFTFPNRNIKSVEQHHIRISLKRGSWNCWKEIRLIQHIHHFFQHPECRKDRDYLQKYIARMIETLDTETFQKVLYTRRIFKDKNINEYIRWAINYKAYEKQIILMNYKSECIGYDTIENTIKKKFDL